VGSMEIAALFDDCGTEAVRLECGFSRRSLASRNAALVVFGRIKDRSC
jgi:hypothetical protein